MKNIKNKSAHFIYYGVDKDTGIIKHISEVPRGAKCNCKCARCGEAFEAKKGTERRHHFAHVSNYECEYAAEVAVYCGFFDALRQLKKIQLPDIKNEERKPVDFKEEDITFIKREEEKGYPPSLFLTIQGRKMRIVLDFGHYYKEAGKEILTEEAKAGGYSLLMYHLPGINQDCFSPEQIKEIIKNGSQADWVFNLRKEEKEKEHREKQRKEAEEREAASTATKEELDAARQEVILRFDPNAQTATIDKYGRRWIQCVMCGKIKEENKIVTYGGPTHGKNRGVCRDCSKNGI